MFNESTYRKAASENGIPLDEVEAEVARQKYLDKGKFPEAPEPVNTGPSENFGKYVDREGNKAIAKVNKDSEDRNFHVLGFDIPDWITPTIVPTAVGAGAYGLKKLSEKNEKAKIDRSTEPSMDVSREARKEPLFDTSTSELPAQQNLTLEQATNRLPPKTTAPSTTQNIPSAVPNVGNQMPSNMATGYGAAPEVTPAVKTSTEIPQGTTEAPTEMIGPPPELVGPRQPVEPPVDIKTRTRRTNEQIAAEKAAQLAATPEGMRPVPINPRQNVGPGETIGVGGYTYAHGAFGPETQQRWEEQYGKTNVPHKQVQKDIAGAKFGPQPEGVSSNFKFTRPMYAPAYIKGAASPQALATTAGLATIPSLATAGYEAYKGNQEAVDKNLSEAWDSLKSVATMPYDVVKAAGKGDFGPLKDMLMSVNPATLLMNATNKHDEEILRQMIAKEKYSARVGAGRGLQGIPPP